MSKKIGRNEPCPCGSGLKYKKCCGSGLPEEGPEVWEQNNPQYDGVPPNVMELPKHKPPLMEGVPNIFMATPWNHVQLSTNFSVAMINMAMAMPFPGTFNVIKSRHTADARNAICLTAIDEGYTHIFMVDADQYVDNSTFGRLWNILEAYGHESTIASAWATIKGGPFKGNTSIIFDTGEGFVAPFSDSLPERPFQAYSIGTPGMLFSTEVLAKIHPPWFADLYIVDDEVGRFNALNEEGIVYWPLERRATHDYVFGIRMTEAGVKIIVDPECKLPHEVVEDI